MVGIKGIYWLVLAVIVIIVIINGLAAVEYEKIANMKGHFGSKYFWFCFFLGPVGWFMIHALPDRRTQEDRGD